MISKAKFSKDRKHRYQLTRVWDVAKPLVGFICLNPSTADETANDPTITRIINYAKLWGYGGVIVANIFAFRATDPMDMKNAEDPVGPNNDVWICDLFHRCEMVVAAWGTHGKHLDRAKQVEWLFDDLYVLGLNKDGSPKHPLYLKKNLYAERWSTLRSRVY